ncbi:MAG TPA: CRISPR system precrRNA processing endoribonuclease RAMP protein Cas6 [Anaerolineae bacterium]|nr:CRISPR system precrRNA processing endoribonuclease RAMP protein Cas6 [Anaerolineae bacterium]
MPYVLTFPLHPDEAAALPRYPGRALHALFYQWLAIGDYALSTKVHDSEGPRPFTVSPIYRVDGQPTLRLTLLDDGLWPALSQGVSLTPTVEVMGHPLTLPTGGPKIERCSYADMVADGWADTRIRLRFLSPTSFRSREMHVPLPDPSLVYQSWLSRWNEFAPEELRINVALLDIVAAHVAVSRYDLRTEMVDLGRNRKAVGFVGVVQYHIIRAGKIGDEWVRRLNLLADYATFCGTGHKTAHGMGHTERDRERR